MIPPSSGHRTVIFHLNLRIILTSTVHRIRIRHQLKKVLRHYHSYTSENLTGFS